MSESIQPMQSAGAVAQKAKVSATEPGNNPAATDDPAGFTAVLAGYIDSDPRQGEAKTDENLAAILAALLPQDMLEDGNTLPQDDNALMWQAVMLLQPAENVTANSGSMTQLQSINLLEPQRKPVLNPSLLNQEYFQSLALKANEGDLSGVPGLATNNITAQLAAAHFSPDTNEALVLKMSEQLIPAQGNNSTLSHGLAAVGFGTATQAATTQTQMAPLNLGQNAWESNLGSRLQMLVGQNVQTAEIRLDPPELGALDIKIKVTNDVATVNITSPHSHVREALESAVPKLREMFAESGVALGDVNVRQESFAQQQHDQSDDKVAGGFVTNDIHEDDPQTVIARKIVSDNMLDTYA